MRAELLSTLGGVKGQAQGPQAADTPAVNTVTGRAVGGPPASQAESWEPDPEREGGCPKAPSKRLSSQGINGQSVSRAVSPSG